MPPTSAQQRAGRRVPQPRRAVLAGRREAGAVRAEVEGPDVLGVAFTDRRQPARRRVQDREPGPVALLPGGREAGAVRAHGGPERSSGQRASRATDAPAGLVEQVKDPLSRPDGDPEPQPRLRGGDPVWVPGT